LSQLVRESLADRIQLNSSSSRNSILKLAGSLNLGGKQPPSRSELYEKHLKQKLGL